MKKICETCKKEIVPTPARMKEEGKNYINIDDLKNENFCTCEPDDVKDNVK